MLTLYVKTGCPFCLAVITKIKELNLEIEEKNVADDAIAEELIKMGGKNQTPYLVDSKNDIKMYESKDIVDYLDTHYGSGKKSEAEDNTPQICTLE